MSSPSRATMHEVVLALCFLFAIGSNVAEATSATTHSNATTGFELLQAEMQCFSPKRVTELSAGPIIRSVFAADLDADGDVDVLAAAHDPDTIAWYENVDGSGTFGVQQLISTSAVGAWSVFAADLDGDGDVDVLSASSIDDKVAWYENVDGLGTFGPQQVISTSADAALSVFAADLDGNGDVDVLVASELDDKISWYENVDGAGTFGAEQVISTSADGAFSVFAADLDGDGDVDVLSASRWDDKIAWYENVDGLGTFVPQQVISTSADGVLSVFATDLDGDGDVDVLSASFLDDKIAWYENVDGSGAFGAEQVISTSAEFAISVFAADFDGDGDNDVLSGQLSADGIMWFENVCVDAPTPVPTATCGCSAELAAMQAQILAEIAALRDDLAMVTGQQ